MDYQVALRSVHRILQPRFYVEIGCWRGTSLALSKCPVLAIDPNPEIQTTLESPTRLYRETSDQFFSRDNVPEILGQPIDLAFIDGMHNVEFALRDFMNLEQHATPNSVILIDDILPEQMEWTTRVRETTAWTGDIYRLFAILRKYRPDLEVVGFDITMKGLGVVSNLDPGNRVLQEAYGEIEADIFAGRYLEPDIPSIRAMIAPRPPAELDDYVISLAARRNKNQRIPVKKNHDNYLELLKKSLLNEIYLPDELRLVYLRDCVDGALEFRLPDYLKVEEAFADRYAALVRSREDGLPFEMNLSKLGFAQTMMGRKRLDSLHHCLDTIRQNGIGGDLVECGVWRGGACIFMAGYLRAYGVSNRRVFVADSFNGLPVPTDLHDLHLDLSSQKVPELAISQATVRRNFEAYDLLDDHIVFLEGWFKDTLPVAPVDQIALLRLDGDLYESTMDCLKSLYDKVAPGGAVIVDDYGAVPACKQAVVDFFSGRGETLPEFQRIDWTGVYWFKAG